MLDTAAYTPGPASEALPAATHVLRPIDPGSARPAVRGKFIYAGSEKLFVRGVTYGTFRPDPDGHEYPPRRTVESDFAQMAASGINAVRVYTMPPVWLLDVAASCGLRVMPSLAVERYAGYLADGGSPPPKVERTLRTALEQIAGHRALLCYAIGNEIPAATVRWLGRTRVERYLGRMYRMIRSADPNALVTYANYPSAEYLQLPFLDVVCFNLYLESPDTFDAYLARLQNIAGDRPLVMSEIGLDSIRNSEPTQARVIDWQLRGAFAAGCAGTFVYSWTDDWHRGGEDVHDWAFGLVRRDRTAKISLSSVRAVYQERTLPVDSDSETYASKGTRPSFSVVVCSYNGSRRIRRCCEALMTLDYPAYEVIVVDDGSTDGTGDVAEAFGFRVIRSANGGLSAARNLGLSVAKGDIVAYIDDDAYPDPHWLTYLASTFATGDFAGVGGPNIVPAEDGPIAHCVANSPGGPVHVLLTDREAEHIPGCNMAFRRDALMAVGGFDTQFRTAGDDVDVCWRLQDKGWKLGFSPAAVVWHHRRGSVAAYWGQQRGYGRAEALLEAKWPAKYNLAGHTTWAGRIYDHTPSPILASRPRVYFGIWGSAPFQHLYQRPLEGLNNLPHVPEWHLVNAALLLITLTGVFWPPLLWTFPFLAAALAFPLAQGIRGAAMARFPGRGWSLPERVWLRVVTAFLHTTQPMARLYGRIKHGLAPWRLRGRAGLQVPRVRTIKFWTDRWRAGDERIRGIEKALRTSLHFVIVGGESDAWDLEVRGGFLGGARLLCAVEENGGGCQTVRFRVWPRISLPAVAVAASLAGLAWAAGRDHAWIAVATLGVAAFALASRIVTEAGFATSAIVERIDQQ
jgi:GT2 family glycosyltransferase